MTSIVPCYLQFTGAQISPILVSEQELTFSITFFSLKYSTPSCLKQFMYFLCVGCLFQKRFSTRFPFDLDAVLKS